MAAIDDALAEIQTKVGTELGVSEWITVDQQMIDTFADCTFDHQWIHIAPERAAKETPFGGTIAHGFLTLSLASKFAYDCTSPAPGQDMAINYGFNKLRFLSPVKAGSRLRGRTMPWMVALFGIVVGPLGVISIYFIIIQPIAIGTYCTICLMAALAMLIMIPFSLDEIVAMVQFMVWNTRRGRPFWRAFFRGDALPGGTTGGEMSFDAQPMQIFRQSARGVTVPWTLGLSAAIGVFLMLSRAIFGNEAAMANSDHLLGALVLTTAVIAWAEVARPLRFLNILFGLWLLIAPWFLGGGTVAGSLVGILAGIALIALSLPRGKRSEEHYGSWDRFII